MFGIAAALAKIEKQKTDNKIATRRAWVTGSPGTALFKRLNIAAVGKLRHFDAEFSIGVSGAQGTIAAVLSSP
jgi:hypothetical protein